MKKIAEIIGILVICVLATTTIINHYRISALEEQLAVVSDRALDVSDEMVQPDILFQKVDAMLYLLERDKPTSGSVSDVLLPCLRRAYDWEPNNKAAHAQIEARLKRLEKWYNGQKTEYARFIKGWGWFDLNVTEVRLLYKPQLKSTRDKLFQEWLEKDLRRL